MKWKPYPKCKDSGVEWLGEVPEHWEIYRLNKSVRLVNEKIDGPLADVLYLGLESVEPGTGRQLEPEVPLQPEGTSNRFQEGHVLFGKLRPYLAKATIAKTHGTCSSEFLVLDPTLLGERVLLYWLLSDGFLKQVDSSTYGAKMPRASWDYIGSLPVPLAPETEQTQIAHFLDRETAKIDTLIAKQQRLIELLQEKRQALISHAVTKGLNPDAPMKPSGVEWLGDIPARWAVTRLAFCSSGIRTGPFGSDLHAEDYVEDGRPVINPANILSGQIVPDPRCTVDEKTAYRLSSHWLTRGDIVVGRRGEMGRCAVVGPEECGWICATGCLRISPNQSVALPDFLQLAIQSQRVREWLSLQSVGSTMENLNASILGRVPLPLPPIVEQAAILARIAKQSVSIDDLIGKANTAIALMREHRTALISAAVTGKIDVREAHQAAHA